MAIFTAQASGTTLTGTNNPDLFILSAATSLAIFGQGGADTIDGFTNTGSLNQSFVTLDGGPDLGVFTGQLSSSVVRLGAGGDTLIVSGNGESVDSSRVLAGDGSDNLQFFDDVEDSDIELGAGADSLFLSSDLTASTVGAGAGRDTLRVRSSIDSSTVNMGGGADSLFVDDNVYNSEVSLGAGSDSVTIFGTASASTILLQEEADKLEVSATNSSLIGGGGGADTIIVTGSFSSQSTINGDGGSDSIVLLSHGTSASSVVDAGEGTDTIQVQGTGGSAGALNVIGGLGADLIEFAESSDIDIKYAAAAESNINNFDTFGVLQNFGFGETATAWVAVSSVLPQQVKVASSIIGANFNVDNSGNVTFKPPAGNTLASRVSALSTDLEAGQFVLFDAEGSQYIFMAGNNLNPSVVDDDLLVQLKDNTNVVGLDTAGNSRIRVEFFTN